MPNPMSVPPYPYIPQIYDASDPDVKTSAMQAASTWAAIYATTSDPLEAGVPWNNAGHLVFSSGIITFKRPDGTSDYFRPDGTSKYVRA